MKHESTAKTQIRHEHSHNIKREENFYDMIRPLLNLITLP